MARSGGQQDRHDPGSDRAALRDDELAVAIAAGHEPALRQLIARYDTVVRYTVFRHSSDRCHADPHWMDSIASDVWTGLVAAIRRDRHGLPSPMRNYIISVSRNQTVSALRKRQTATKLDTVDLEAAARSPDADAPDPGRLAEDLEDLTALRECLATLSGDDRTLANHLADVVDRRWRDVAAALDLPESTVRSRWKRVLEQLRACVRGKIGRDFAPGGEDRDH